MARGGAGLTRSVAKRDIRGRAQHDERRGFNHQTPYKEHQHSITITISKSQVKLTHHATRHPPPFSSSPAQRPSPPSSHLPRVPGAHTP